MKDEPLAVESLKELNLDVEKIRLQSEQDLRSYNELLGFEDEESEFYLSEDEDYEVFKIEKKKEVEEVIEEIEEVLPALPKKIHNPILEEIEEELPALPDLPPPPPIELQAKVIKERAKKIAKEDEKEEKKEEKEEEKKEEKEEEPEKFYYSVDYPWITLSNKFEEKSKENYIQIMIDLLDAFKEGKIDIANDKIVQKEKDKDLKKQIKAIINSGLESIAANDLYEELSKFISKKAKKQRKVIEKEEAPEENPNQKRIIEIFEEIAKIKTKEEVNNIKKFIKLIIAYLKKARKRSKLFQ